MLKLSITLPNNAQINLESEDEVVIDRILGIVLADVTRALLAGISVPDPGVGGTGAIESAVPPAPSPSQPSVSLANITNAPVAPPEETPLQVSEPVLTPVDEQPGALFNMGSVPRYDQQRELAQEGEPVPTERETATQDPPPPTWPRSDLLSNGVGTTNGSPAGVGNHAGMPSLVPVVSEQAFVDFCRAANPLGDMRRVVVAAEGASRYLAIDGVDADSLGSLFDIVGWPRAHNFVQTLRNAARSKFGWLERIPGRAGHYSVTDLGRSTALGR